MFPWLRIGGVTMPVFYLVQSLNLCLLFGWTFRRARTWDLPVRRAIDFTMILAVAGLIGGRLLHVLWEAPDYYQADPMRVFDMGSGGFVYYGGLFFAAAAGWLALIVTAEKNRARWFDFFAPVLSLGTAVGRLGCLFAGCCYGRVCDLPWAIKVMDENGAFLSRHPAPLYSFAWEIGELAILVGLEKKPEARPGLLRKPGASFALWALLHGLGRFLIEFIRDDFRGPAVAGLSLSQFLSLGLIAVAAAWIAFKPLPKTAAR